MNEEELKEEIKWLEDWGLLPKRCKNLVELAESVLKAQDCLPQKKCTHKWKYKNGVRYQCELCEQLWYKTSNDNNEEVNAIIDACTLAIAKNYILKSSLPSEHEIKQIISDIALGDMADSKEEKLAQAIRKLITGE